MNSKYLATVIALFILSTLSKITAQDESRLGIKAGYYSSFTIESIGLNDNFNIDRTELSVERFLPLMNSLPFVYGVELNKYDMRFRSSNIDNFIEDNAFSIGIYLGVSTSEERNLKAKLYALAEFDLIKPDNPRMPRANGFGSGISVEYDIHLNDTFVLSFGPRIGARFLGNFGQNEAVSEFDITSVLELGGSINFYYKFY